MVTPRHLENSSAMDEDSVALNVGFKGTRNYIQGGDIYNAIDACVRATRSESYIQHLAFRHFARRDCDLLWTEPKADVTLIGQGRSVFGEEQRRFWVSESSRDAAGRRPYDEDSIVRSSTIEGRQITLTHRSVYTPIEEIIALTKRLAYHLAPDVDGKWVFGQLDLTQRIPETYDKVVIRQKKVLASRFSVNEIVVDDNTIGSIRFIVGDP